MARYRVLLPLMVHTEDGSYTQFEEFEKDFTPDEEQANVNSGLLAIVPRKYRVLVGEWNGVKADAEDPTVEAALLIENEAALLQGGHIERVEEPAPKKQQKPKEAKK